MVINLDPNSSALVISNAVAGSLANTEPLSKYSTPSTCIFPFHLEASKLWFSQKPQTFCFCINPVCNTIMRKQPGKDKKKKLQVMRRVNTRLLV